MELFPPLHVQESVDLLSRIQSKALLKKRQRLIAPKQSNKDNICRGNLLTLQRVHDFDPLPN